MLPNERFFPVKWEPTESWARYAFDRVCELMRVDRERVELYFVQDAWSELRRAGVPVGPRKDAAGTYFKVDVDDGPSRALVAIKNTVSEEPEAMVATMAHELAHVLLLGDNRIEHELDGMEPLTDLMTVFSGFGVLNANSAYTHRSGLAGWSVSTLGYLAPREFGYSLAVFAAMRGERKPEWERELKTNVRAAMRASLQSFSLDRKSWD